MRRKWEVGTTPPDVPRWSAARTIAIWSVVIVVALAAFIYLGTRQGDGLFSRVPPTLTALEGGPLPASLRVTRGGVVALLAGPATSEEIITSVREGSVLRVGGRPVKRSLADGSKQTWWPVFVPGTSDLAYISDYFVLYPE